MRRGGERGLSRGRGKKAVRCYRRFDFFYLLGAAEDVKRVVRDGRLFCEKTVSFSACLAAFGGIC